jgi:hypothetical protein
MTTATLAVNIVSNAVEAVRGFDALTGAVGRAGNEVAGFGRAIDGASRQARDFGRGVADRLDAIGGGSGKAATGINDLAGAMELAGLGSFAEKMGIAATVLDAGAGAADLFTVAQSIASAAVNALSASTAAATVRTLAYNVATRTVSAATTAWTAVQWLLNAALTANPIGLVVVAIAALVAGIILAYKNSETFRRIVDGAFRAVADGAKTLWDWVTRAASAIGDGLSAAFSFVSRGIDTFIEKIMNAVRWVQDLIAKVRDFIVPDWLSNLVSGRSVLPFSVPCPNRFAYVPADPGQGRLAASPARLTRLAMRAAQMTVNVFLDGKRVKGIVERVVSDALNADGSRLAAGAWG